jgi:hypothetical protein
MKDYRKFFKQLLEQHVNEEEEEEVDVETEETEKGTFPEKKKEGKDDEDEEDEEEEEGEEELIKIFEDEAFVDAFKNSTKQYVSEKILDEEYNSFTIIPLIETTYKDETYSISVEFSSSVSINVDEEGKVVDKDIAGIETIKFKTPVMDVMALLENESAKGLVELTIIEALDDIKKVPR